jgi:hypothetical protein
MKLIATSGLILALAALTAAGAQGADLIVPHSATHTVSPQPAPQPSSPSPAPGSGPAPASEPESHGPYNDVGHNPGEAVDPEVGGPSPTATLESAANALQGFVDAMQADMSSGLAESPLASAFLVAHINEVLGELSAKLVQLYREEELSKPEVAVRQVLGYSEVTGEPCGADFQTLNEDDNQSNNLASC